MTEWRVILFVGILFVLTLTAYLVFAMAERAKKRAEAKENHNNDLIDGLINEPKGAPMATVGGRQSRVPGDQKTILGEAAEPTDQDPAAWKAPTSRSHKIWSQVGDELWPATAPAPGIQQSDVRDQGYAWLGGSVPPPGLPAEVRRLERGFTGRDPVGRGYGQPPGFSTEGSQVEYLSQQLAMIKAQLAEAHSKLEIAYIDPMLAGLQAVGAPVSVEELAHWGGIDPLSADFSARTNKAIGLGLLETKHIGGELVYQLVEKPKPAGRNPEGLGRGMFAADEGVGLAEFMMNLEDLERGQ